MRLDPHSLLPVDYLPKRSGKANRPSLHSPLLLRCSTKRTLGRANHLKLPSPHLIWGSPEWTLGMANRLNLHSLRPIF